MQKMEADEEKNTLSSESGWACWRVGASKSKWWTILAFEGPFFRNLCVIPNSRGGECYSIIIHECWRGRWFFSVMWLSSLILSVGKKVSQIFYILNIIRWCVTNNYLVAGSSSIREDVRMGFLWLFWCNHMISGTIICNNWWLLGASEKEYASYLIK